MSKKTIRTVTSSRIQYRFNDRFHRENGPAVVWDDGTLVWLKHGEYHREDGPAIIYPDGTLIWFLNSKYHRDDGPAMVHSNGNEEWYRHGEKVPPS